MAHHLSRVLIYPRCAGRTPNSGYSRTPSPGKVASGMMKYLVLSPKGNIAKVGRSFPNSSDGGLGRLWGPDRFRGCPTGSPTAPAASSLRVAGCGPRVTSPPGGQRPAEWRPRAGESPPARPPSPPGESRPPGSGGQHQLLDGRCPKAPVAGLQPLLQSRACSAQIGAREASARAGFAETPGAPGDPPAKHSAPPSRPSAPLSSLRAPRLRVKHSDPKGLAPSSTPSEAASRRLARDQEELASGVLRVPGSPSPPRPPPSRPLCARSKAQ